MSRISARSGAHPSSGLPDGGLKLGLEISQDGPLFGRQAWPSRHHSPRLAPLVSARDAWAGGRETLSMAGHYAG
jgi:hypothetical protein